jgi:hypothetical protein
MKNEVPVALAFAAGMLMVVSLFVPHPYIAGPAAVARSWAIIITAFAYVLGVANIARISIHTVRKKAADWEYKAALLVALAAMVGVGLARGIQTGSPFDWAFRARSVEATLLLVTAAIVMLGRVPIGEHIWGRLPDLTEWIMEVPNMAAKRGIMIGAALGAISTGLKMILGLERSYLGGE